MKQKKAFSLNDLMSTASLAKISIPVFLGIVVVAFLMWKSFDAEAMSKLTWNDSTLIFLLLTCIMLVIRHLAYSWRLRIISNDHFTWWKSIELIFLWEFGSTISPTSFGGAATSLLFLTQEKLSAAKSVTIVLYSVVLDTLFYLLSVLMLLFWLGPKIIRPNLTDIWSLNGYSFTFWIVILIMFLYGFFIYYGLYINPGKMAGTLKSISKISFLKRFKASLKKTARDIIIASNELKQASFSFHAQSFLATGIAWFCRYSTIPLIMFAVIDTLKIDFINFWLIYGRHQIMFALTAFSPTPGGSGIAEAFFGGFFTDYMSTATAVIVALIWRVLTYYSYLFAGVIILPLWIRKVMARKKIDL